MLCYYYIMAIPRYVILHRGITASGGSKPPNHVIGQSWQSRGDQKPSLFDTYT